MQKWQTVHITHIAIEKGKHVHFDVEGPTPTSLHFSTGSRDNAEAIVEKLETSRAISMPGAVPSVTESAVEDEEIDEPAQKPRDVRKPSVHFQPGSPTIIPPKDTPSDEEPDEVEPDEPMAVVLYDFTADGPDELSAKEGERLILLEDDDPDWWKCRNARNQEGVVPASYLEVKCLHSASTFTHRPQPTKPSAGSSSPPRRATDPPEEDDDAEEREVADRAQAEAAAEAEAVAKAKAKSEREAKREADRKKAEAEKRAKEAADAADARRRQRQKQQEEANKRSTPPPGKPEESSPSPRPSTDQGR